MMIEVVNDLGKILGEWDDLWARVPDAAPFQNSGWLMPWWDAFGSGELLCLAVRDADRLIGFAPLFLHEWEGRRQVTFLGNGVSDRLGILAETDCEAAVADLVVEGLAKQGSRWDICDLQDLSGASPLLQASVPGGLRSEVCPQYVCSVVPLPGTVEEFHAGLTHGLRRNLRRYRNQLEQCGPVTIETVGEDDFGPALEALFELHRARWAMKDEKGMLDGPAMESFHREAAWALRGRGIVRLHVLRVAGAIAAVVYAFIRGRRAYSYLGGFDPALARYSPGALSVEYAISQAIEEGATEFDFLRGDESYKSDWGAEKSSSYRLRLRQA